MWYVIQVETGREAHIQQLIERNVDAASYREVFAPKLRTMKRIRGQWRESEGLLIPGYLFVITDTPGAFARELRAVPAFTRLLGNDDLFTPLSDEEAAFIDAFTSAKHRVVGMSSGVIEGDRVVLTGGPLVGHEALIVRIDRHKRLAWIEFEILGRRKQVSVGLEIVSKRAAAAAACGTPPSRDPEDLRT